MDLDLKGGILSKCSYLVPVLKRPYLPTRAEPLGSMLPFFFTLVKALCLYNKVILAIHLLFIIFKMLYFHKSL